MHEGNPIDAYAITGIPSDVPQNQRTGYVLDLQDLHQTLRPGSHKPDPTEPHGDLPGHNRPIGLEE